MVEPTHPKYLYMSSIGYNYVPYRHSQSHLLRVYSHLKNCWLQIEATQDHIARIQLLQNLHLQQDNTI